MPETEPIEIRMFTLTEWRSLEELWAAYLAEHGIEIDPADFTDAPEDTPPGSEEWDLDHIEQVYLAGGGGFWMAWAGDTAVGCVGAQDLGGVTELRRMRVRAEYRKQGIGKRLVNALIDHCRSTGIAAIEVWTDFDGIGQYLYRSCGFREVAERGPEFAEALLRDEMRFRFDF